MRLSLLPLLPALSAAWLLAGAAAPAATQGATEGYYRFPDLHGSTLVFTAHGDLWKVDAGGGVAQSLTSHAGSETHPAISPDGAQVAFTGTYEGPAEVYVMPLSGGLPTRLTYHGESATVVGWTPDGKVLCATRWGTGLPDTRLVAIDPRTRASSLVPLSQAAEGSYGPDGTLYFTRQAFQGSHTKRYRGGTAQQLWKFAGEGREALPLTRDYPGTSKTPMFWNGRVYFASDRDGTMNLWSMAPDGTALTQHTRHAGWDVQSPALSDGRIAYQLGADLHLFDLRTGEDRKLAIRLQSDLDQTREKWVKEPAEYLTSARLSADGSRVALTARGQVFVAPAEPGRLVEVTRRPAARYRNARFLPDGKSLLALSDQTGETEFWRLPASGIGEGEPLSSGSKVLQIAAEVSPDGKRVAFSNLASELWIFDLDDREQRLVARSQDGPYRDFSWSPDSRWLAYAQDTDTFTKVMLHQVGSETSTAVTSGRSDAYSTAWSPDGRWLYFLSDRHFSSQVPSPWGPRQPEPYFDRQTKLYQVALRKGLRSPFSPDDELSGEKPSAGGEEKEKESAPKVEINLSGLERRVWELPVAPGNYSGLSVTGSRVLWLASETGSGTSLMALDITNKSPEAKALASGVSSYELSGNLRKLLLRRGSSLYVIDAGAPAPASLTKKDVSLSGWSFALNPREEWRQMFVDAWRLERDYFYDPKLHGVDWNGVLKQYLPLVDRVTDRDELSDLIAQMVGELSALHSYVFGGDTRRGDDSVYPASLGAELARDEAAGGYRVTRIYRADPDYPDDLAPLHRPGVDVEEGDVIESINGVATLSVPDPAILLRNQAGRQVLLQVKPGGEKKSRQVIATPIAPARLRALRYTDWELSRRDRVDREAGGRIGYVHLRAMGTSDMAQWMREFYPVVNRQGLIIDVRHNGGGNIDSWILSRLLRKAWFYWQPRNGRPTPNMHWAFRGHIVVLCDEWTASDGEAFTEGFRRLGLGKVIGTRTWGGEIWLSYNNYLSDNGIASAAQTGVYGPEGVWLIEGHGVDPDVVVDNLPHATFKGEDAQLQAAVAHLERLIREDPRPVPKAPPYPDKSHRPAAGPASQP